MNINAVRLGFDSKKRIIMAYLPEKHKNVFDGKDVTKMAMLTTMELMRALDKPFFAEEKNTGKMLEMIVRERRVPIFVRVARLFKKKKEE